MEKVTLSQVQREHEFVMVNLCSDKVSEQPMLVMKTSGAQYLYQLLTFRSETSMQAALLNMDPSERHNAVSVPGQWAFLITAGNMQHIPMERLVADDVYADVMECKHDAARWVSEHWNMIIK